MKNQGFFVTKQPEMLIEQKNSAGKTCGVNVLKT